MIVLLLYEIIEVCFLMISHIWLIPDPLDEVKIDADSDLVYQFPVISLLGFPWSVSSTIHKEESPA